MAFSRDPIAEKWPELVRIMLARLVILAGLFIGLVAIVPTDAIAFYAVVALAFVVNIPYALWLRDERKAAGSAPMQFLVDAVAVTGLVHFSGGIESELCLLYPLVILSAGIVGGGRAAVKLTLLSILLYSCLIVLEMNGVLPYIGSPPSPYADSLQAARRLMLRVFIFAFFSAASNFLADRCVFQARQIRRYREWMETVFQHVSVGLFVVDADGVLVLANRAGAEMLGVPVAQLPGRRFADFRAQSDAAGPLADSAGPVQLRRADGTAFPALLDVAPARLPIGVSAGTAGGESGDMAVHIVAVRDVSAEAQARQAREEAARLRTAFRMVAALAHAVRNPLTSIRGAAESLAAVMAKVSSPGGLSDRDRRTVETLHRVLIDEVTQLDAKVEEFLTRAASDPERLFQGAAEKYFGQGRGGAASAAAAPAQSGPRPQQPGKNGAEEKTHSDCR